MTEPSATAPHLNRSYQPELDVLRLFAFLLVFLHHKTGPIEMLHRFGNLPHATQLVLIVHVFGAYGVNLFFLLSSYLITRNLRSEVSATGQLDLRAFYLRRILRIGPLYLFFLLLLWILSHSGVEPAIPNGFFLASLAFASNWYLEFHGFVWLPAVVVWTLGIEEQFYLVWPLLLRHGQRKRILAVSIGSMIISHAALFYFCLHHLTEDFQISYNTLTQIQFFGAGAILALWAEKRDAFAMSVPARIGLFVIGIAAYLVAALFDARAHVVAAGILTFNVAYLFVLTGTVSLFRSFLGAPSRLFPRWAIFLGRISYGLYLFNLLSVFLVRPLVRNRVPISIEVLLTLLTNIALAVASWYLLEKPFLRLKARIAYPRTASFIRD